VDDFVGPVIIVFVLLVLPGVFLMAGGLAAVILGSALQRTVEKDHAGSEFVDLNR
jgi:hypothetical protein